MKSYHLFQDFINQIECFESVVNNREPKRH